MFVFHLLQQSNGKVRTTLHSVPITSGREIVRGFYDADKARGNRGKDVINATVEWIVHGEPKKEFDNVKGDLDYRWDDAANK
ncbi:hypothetical protein VTN00DRAFT_2695 [Thermoascus crustaceus]|uniref:uncharacterized protein n=1 Tax=Thermoascus crustaceus TaxID=5088 RepID=UPI00374207CA